MKKFLYIFSLLFLLGLNQSFSQVGERITSLPPGEASQFATPLSTWFGSYFNSGGYYSASVPSTFGFKFSIIGMYIFIPDGQTTFTPNLPEGYNGSEGTATFFGDRGGVYLGPQGFLIYPFGLNLQSVPAGIYQASGSMFGAELMLRFFPKLKINDVSANLWGIGLKYSISQFIPLSPVDIAVQILYNNFNFDFDGDNNAYDFKSDSKNFAANVHVSKTFSGMFTLYGGLQYESTTMDLTYNFRDPDGAFPNLAGEQQVTVDGDNNFRFTLGAAVKLAVIVFNVDYNISSQNLFTGGISLEL
jgi:Family of unknown function (DUF6588)